MAKNEGDHTERCRRRGVGMGRRTRDTNVEPPFKALWLRILFYVSKKKATYPQPVERMFFFA